MNSMQLKKVLDLASGVDGDAFTATVYLKCGNSVTGDICNPDHSVVGLVLMQVLKANELKNIFVDVEAIEAVEIHPA